jgi:hypothetical protein
MAGGVGEIKPDARDEALLWLNDRCGRTVQVEVVTSAGEVFATRGPLSHWRESPAGKFSGGAERDDIAGMYDVGGAVINLTTLPEGAEVQFRGARDEDQFLVVALGASGDAWLQVVTR